MRLIAEPAGIVITNAVRRGGGHGGLADLLWSLDAHDRGGRQAV